MRRRLLLLALVAGLSALAQPASLGAAAPAPDSNQAVAHILNRLSYGARPGEPARVAAIGIAAWVERQLAPERLDDSALDARLAALETLNLSSQTIALDYDRQAMQDLAEGKVLRAVYSERQLQEILVDFWFNHFNVFAGKGQTRIYVTEYERDVVRPHVLGSFRDLLGATAKSPAMLFYLDNWLSAASDDGSMQKLRRNRAAGPDAPPRTRGINENYARELMELHTLGVDGGYTQQDIVEVARAFTGWTMRPRQGTGFTFAPALHDRGSKVVLGQTIAAGGGVDDGERVLDILAAHSATARHIATKLVQRFVADVPPEALVARAAAKFTATHGDLRAVTRIIVTSPEFLAPAAYRSKTKTPLEFVASAIRATGADMEDAQAVVRTLRELGMPPYMCQPPTGYDETAEAWMSAGALVARMNFGLALGRNRLRHVTLPAVGGEAIDATRARLVADALAGEASATTLATLSRATSADQAVALTIGAPEFQKQ